MWTRRKQGNAVGRVVACHPTERERYYLRLLLMNIRGPKSYEDLRTVSGRYYNTFREAAEKNGLLASDNNLIECMSEAANYQMPYSLRYLFATLLAYWAFFIDGPGGIGKTYLYHTLLATVRSKGFIALATATSGVAASVLPGGRTAHSRFKLPIDTRENCACNISKQSSLASLIRDAKLIVWDEVSMAKKKLIETFDSFLKDIMNTDTLFGGKVVVFGGDFRQTLPVIQNGKKEDFINESLLNSTIWDHLEKYQLVQNMCAKIDPTFCEYLLKIGSGKQSVNALDICGPAESKEKRVKYLNMILQDKQQINPQHLYISNSLGNFCNVIFLFSLYFNVEHTTGRSNKGHCYSDDIPCYQDRIKIYHTYYIAGTRMQPSSSKYEKPLHAFELVFDKKSVLLEVEENDVDALPLPTKLTVISFTDIKQQVLQATTDLNKKEFGVSLTTKFNTTILIDPPYAQSQQLRAWITENKPTLTSFTLRSTSKSGSLISIPVDEEVILIANAESQEDGQTFSIEVKISFPANQKKYYVLVCSNCGQDVRYPIIMQIHCMNCGQHRMLIPRCRFNVNLEDSSGTTTGMIMNKEGEKLLSLTAEQIYERTSTKNNCPPMKDLDTGFINKIFFYSGKKGV
ncbi:hypothetical protein KY284_030056 [Solanum tuberosum]|nr:hypothetical protein KY284_030056 [Solanum tuberosum]